MNDGPARGTRSEREKMEGTRPRHAPLSAHGEMQSSHGDEPEQGTRFLLVLEFSRASQNHHWHQGMVSRLHLLGADPMPLLFLALHEHSCLQSAEPTRVSVSLSFGSFQGKGGDGWALRIQCRMYGEGQMVAIG